MIIAILRPVDHKRRVELERGEETHLRDSRTDYYDKSRVVSRIHNGNELVLELVMNLNQVQEGHVFSITQRDSVPVAPQEKAPKKMPPDKSPQKIAPGQKPPKP